jgi:integrase
MNQYFKKLAPWEVESENRNDRYLRGIELLERHDWLDPRDEFELNELNSRLTLEQLKSYVFAFEVERARRDGHSLSAPDSMAPTEATASTERASNAATKAPATSDVTLDEAIKRFSESQRNGGARIGTVDKSASHCRLFQKIVTNPRVPLRLSQLTIESIRLYADTLSKIPRKTLPTDPRPLSEILKQDGARMAPKTKFSHARSVNMFLNWCREQQYSVTPDYSAILKSLLKKPSSQTDRRDKGFTHVELQLLFGSCEYIDGKFKTASEFWLPLLALFTAARQAELCQLSSTDIYQHTDDETWLMSINNKGDKLLKNTSSDRVVPIHPSLIKLGWLDFVDEAKQSGREQLFPNEKRNKRGEFSAYSKRFNRYKAQLGINSCADAKKDFHSFRHTVQGFLFGNGEEEYIINKLVGHSKAGSSEGIKTYARGGPNIPALVATLCKLDYEFAISKIKQDGWRR